MSEAADSEAAAVVDLARLRALAATAPGEALRGVERHLAAHPRDPEALRIAAAAHRGLGRKDLAERAEIAAIDAGRTVPEIAEATRLVAARDFGGASRVAAMHLRRYPDDLGAATLSAETAIALGLPDRAIPLLERVLLRAPSYLMARTLLINALGQVDRLRDARSLLDPVVRRMPDSARFQELLAKIAGNQGDFATAIEASAAVTRLEGASVDAWLDYGDNLRFGGRKAEAIAAYRTAIGVAPDHGRVWWSLADIDAAALDDGDLSAIRDAIGNRAQEPDHLGNLRFALGMAEHARGNPAEAFAQFSAGNATRRAAEPHDAELVPDQVDRYLAELTADRIPPLRAPIEGQPTPIFIVGMPRSGSTLVERVLGRSTQVEALGELAIVPHMIERIKRDAPDGDLALAIANLPEDQLANMGQWYLERAGELARQRPPRPYFTDKMHMNWRHLPLILRMLPQALVIDVRRDAMDCCWSNYRTLFARGHSAANDLADIGRFYRDYVRLTDGLRARAPDRIHLVCYEELVEDFDAGLRRLFAALGLDFEPGVAAFHLSDAPVATASSEQVRQPLNRKGIGAWRAYAPWLDPLRDALGDLAGE